MRRLFTFCDRVVALFQMRFLLSLESGGHLHIPGVEYHEVKAFRLEPEIPSSSKGTGHIAIDGEVRIDNNIIAEVL